jgi:ASCH domain.
MKALSLKEPWASLVLEGRKTIETRVWKTNYRGQLLLCASKNPKSCISGKAFATANLVEIRPMKKTDEAKACCKVYEGAYAWILADITPIKQFDVKGSLGLFNVDYKMVD